MRRKVAPLLGLTLAATASPASANISALTDNGFVVRQTVEVDADAPKVWARLIEPSLWWNPEHTFSDNSANLTLDLRPGGCFCETLPGGDGPGGDGATAPHGGVEHMRLVHIDTGRALRMSGGLGPLQSEAVNGTMTITLKPLDGGGTRILWEYVVGGFMRYKTGQIAPAVDKVLAEQMTRLAGELGPRAVAASPESAPPAQPKPEGR